MHLKNESNEYVESLPPGMFDSIPKAVWAAIAISRLSCGGDRLEDAPAEIQQEWQALFDNGIVKQKPKKAKTRSNK